MLQPTGTIPWMAPEFLEDRNTAYNAKTEVYSYAVLLWEIFCAKAVNNKGFSDKLLLMEPYPYLQPVQVIYQVTTNGLRPELATLNEDEEQLELMINIYRLIQCCWQHRPEDRPSFEEIIAFLCEQLQLCE